MMDEPSKLKLQAWVDGELPPAEARECERLVANDREARLLADELTFANRALSEFESLTKLPVSREFYWSGIHKRIQSLENCSASAPMPSPAAPWLAMLRRLLVPAGAAAALGIAALLAFQQSRTDDIAAPAFEATLASAGTFTYRDFDSGTTLVWLSYPAESENEFADIDTILKLP